MNEDDEEEDTATLVESQSTEEIEERGAGKSEEEAPIHDDNNNNAGMVKSSSTSSFRVQDILAKLDQQKQYNATTPKRDIQNQIETAMAVADTQQKTPANSTIDPFTILEDTNNSSHSSSFFVAKKQPNVEGEDSLQSFYCRSPQREEELKEARLQQQREHLRLHNQQLVDEEESMGDAYSTHNCFDSDHADIKEEKDDNVKESGSTAKDTTTTQAENQETNFLQQKLSLLQGPSDIVNNSSSNSNTAQTSDFWKGLLVGLYVCQAIFLPLWVVFNTGGSWETATTSLFSLCLWLLGRLVVLAVTGTGFVMIAMVAMQYDQSLQLQSSTATNSHTTNSNPATVPTLPPRDDDNTNNNEHQRSKDLEDACAGLEDMTVQLQYLVGLQQQQQKQQQQQLEPGRDNDRHPQQIQQYCQKQLQLLEKCPSPGNVQQQSSGAMKQTRSSSSVQQLLEIPPDNSSGSNKMVEDTSPITRHDDDDDVSTPLNDGPHDRIINTTVSTSSRDGIPASISGRSSRISWASQHSLLKLDENDDENTNDDDDRLTNSFVGHNESMSQLLQVQKPQTYADFYSLTTVLVAHVSGFSSWCSEREPLQVFEVRYRW